ncbi:hypothetical protein CVT24_013029 [Panaeolus cyanescens]|uniref:Uncharacterized protein n=1 Tax=Panaeolus cyanescens TaxID=181874 RepID=A0A409YUK4_9AGAR|nr:hypothetical protein CVT24_013029 [Panaeolus cyanescens]
MSSPPPDLPLSSESLSQQIAQNDHISWVFTELIKFKSEVDQTFLTVTSFLKGTLHLDDDAYQWRLQSTWREFYDEYKQVVWAISKLTEIMRDDAENSHKTCFDFKVAVPNYIENLTFFRKHLEDQYTRLGKIVQGMKEFTKDPNTNPKNADINDTAHGLDQIQQVIRMISSDAESQLLAYKSIEIITDLDSLNKYREQSKRFHELYCTGLEGLRSAFNCKE